MIIAYTSLLRMESIQFSIKCNKDGFHLISDEQLIDRKVERLIACDGCLTFIRRYFGGIMSYGYPFAHPDKVIYNGETAQFIYDNLLQLN